MVSCIANANNANWYAKVIPIITDTDFTQSLCKVCRNL